jgi:hypothetical protein
MKFETLLLKSLFAACLLICVLALSGMLASHTNVSNVVANHALVAATVSAAS